MNVLDLFSGIGGFSLGLERAGMRTVAFCEIDPYCRRVLAKHWPDVPVYEDVRTLTAQVLADAECPRLQRGTGERLSGSGRSPIEPTSRIDVICGGFPCQDISIAGKGAGIKGERSGLWKEYARIIGEVRPRYVIVENVSALLSRGLGDVLRDLAALGYDAEWHCIPASAVGAPHRRDRIWIVAHANSRWRRSDIAGRDHADRTNTGRSETDCMFGAVRESGGAAHMADAHARRELQSQGRISDIWRWIGDSGWWESEPDVGRVAHGIPSRVDRLKALGNAVVPQIPEIIGRAIMRAEGL